eukprot:6182420-Pleurochrysis_carterae.AAC.1
MVPGLPLSATPNVVRTAGSASTAISRACREADMRMWRALTVSPTSEERCRAARTTAPVEFARSTELISVKGHHQVSNHLKGMLLIPFMKPP